MFYQPNHVAPLVGAWIEIYEIAKQLEIYVVAPLVGAWIEMVLRHLIMLLCGSLPSWERGLKYQRKYSP